MSIIDIEEEAGKALVKSLGAPDDRLFFARGDIRFIADPSRRCIRVLSRSSA